MDFRINFPSPTLPEKISHAGKILLTGSCFTEHIGNFLTDARFKTMINPNGIVFNPVSIVSAITSWIEKKTYGETDLFYHNEGWHSWDHHSRFSNPSASIVLEEINRAVGDAHDFLQEADWLIISVGSAFVYELKDKPPGLYTPGRENDVVANCHKVPNDRFRKRLLPAEEIIASFGNLIYRLQLLNARLKIILTVSPVRHTRDGVIENNRSKAALIQSVHHLVEKFENIYYFPAYEIVIDELRDYRFYMEDMVHPNALATRYVAERFQAACIDAASYPLIKEMEMINIAMKHKPFNPASAAHKKFLDAQLKKLKELKEKYPSVDFEKEVNFFNGASRETH
ncbi:MAG: GSCFA domain-containing protein [Chitinophagaceae bacterium]|nr:GSCFA domain-containing protein [Chitinophagaceae bacterium]MCW5925907.1 GSCFA domain-containing protein [Chitinophagaceae bacterium]